MRHRIAFAAATALLALVIVGGPARAQAPTPTPFDGHYVGTSTLTGADTACATIPKIATTIRNGQVAIREFMVGGKKPIYRGTVDAAGKITAQFSCIQGDIGGGGARGGCFIINGTISGNTFTGQRHMGVGCYFNIQMTKDRSGGDVENE